MAEVELPYAHWRATPDAGRLRIIRVADGAVLEGVIEASAAEGWYVQKVRGLPPVIVDGERQAATRRVECEIRIVRTIQDPEIAAARIDAAERKRARRAARLRRAG